MKLWDWVKQTVTPLGQPRPSRSVAAPLIAQPVNRHPKPNTLDLHGLTIQAAYQEVINFIHEARYNGRGNVVIITGKSGEICREFPHWVNKNVDVRSFRETNGGGAFVVRLRPPQPKAK